MTYQVTNYLTKPTLSALKIVDARFYRGNIKDEEMNDPRIQLKVCIQGLNENGVYPHEGIDPNAWFLTILRKSREDEGGHKLQTKVGSVLRCLGLALPESYGLIKGMEQATEIIKTGLSNGPLLMAGLVTTTLAAPVPNGDGGFKLSPRYANVVYFNQEISAWVRSL